MRAHVHRQPQHNRPRFKALPWKQLLAIIGIMLLVFACVPLILSSLNIIPGYWSAILSSIFGPTGIIISIIAWIFPPKPKPEPEPEPEPLPLASALERTNARFNLGGKAAAEFPYVNIQGIQETYNVATKTLQRASTGEGDKVGILILGEANAGKTRMAFEALTHTLPSWPVLILSPSSKLEDIPQRTVLNGPGLVLFIDDLQNYTNPSASGQTGVADTPGEILKKMIGKIQDVINPVIVATCRSENKQQAEGSLGYLWERLEVISIPRFNSDNSQSDKIIAAFQEKGNIYPKDWDGTPGSLVLVCGAK